MATPAFEEIVEDFEFLDDWEDRYRHVIEQGKAMEPLDDVFKVPATKVHGCASQVWLHPMIEKGVFRFDGDSDALIVRGLIAVFALALQRLARGPGCNSRCGRGTGPSWIERPLVCATFKRIAIDDRAHPRGRSGKRLRYML